MQASALIPKPKVIEIAAQTGIGPSDLRVRFKRTYIGLFYINYIKPIAPIHRSIVKAWRAWFPLYVQYVSILLLPKKTKRWRTLVGLKSYVEKNNFETIEILGEVSVVTSTPRIFSEDGQSFLSLKNSQRGFPPIYVAAISDSIVYGGTNLVFSEGIAIHHDLYNFELDYTSEELHGRHLVDPTRNRMRLLYDDVTPYRMTIAASFTDACAQNYSHWLTEVLPRIAAFCSIERYAHVPLVVDEGLHANVMESLYAISGSSRQIVVLPLGRGIEVNRLLVTSVAGYVPFERRSGTSGEHSHGTFSTAALVLLRASVFSYLDKMSTEHLPKKIYLERGKTHRSVENEDQIRNSLFQFGFCAIKLETLSFLQQVAILRHAEIVVGPSGAALANLIFSNIDQSIHILIAKHPEMPYFYWPNMISVQRLCVNYVVGQASSVTQGIHSNFYIDPENLIESISRTSKFIAQLQSRSPDIESCALAEPD